MLVNPLVVLRCQQIDSILFVSTFPADSSTLGVADHYSRYCYNVDFRVFTGGTHDLAFVSSLVVETSFLGGVYQATWIHLTLK